MNSTHPHYTSVIIAPIWPEWSAEARHEAEERGFDLAQNPYTPTSRISDAYIILCEFYRAGYPVESIRAGRGSDLLVNGERVRISGDIVLINVQ